MPSSHSASVQGYPVFHERIPAQRIERGRYALGFATRREQLEAVQRLRFEVFNLELGEGLDASYRTGRDEDRFDPVCHHLVVVDPAGRAVGTYRMQTSEMAERHLGFYSDDEFDLSGLPDEVRSGAVEIGRACVAREHRNRHVLYLLWQGLAAYMIRNDKRYLFGCCSLTSQDPALGRAVMDHLLRLGHVHPTYDVAPRPGWSCHDGSPELGAARAAEPVELPRLFSLYLRYGAQVCGAPALDRHFKTIDYLVLFDRDRLDAESRAAFFG